MADWARIRGIYGPADGVPGLLDAALGTDSWESPAWNSLWEQLYHQGTVAPASYEAIPKLTGIALAHREVRVDPALFLVCAILSSTYGPLDRAEVRARFLTSVESLGPVAHHKLALADADQDFVYALQCVAAIEDLGAWQWLLEGLADEEVEFECPACGDHVYIEVTEDALIATQDSGAIGGRTPIPSTDRSQLDGQERYLIDLVVAHGRRRLQDQLASLFSTFTCPNCAQQISVAQAGR
jgi:predicted RNA-binding Zn-ribbon protein involved in translation (DUF1610 family)